MLLSNRTAQFVAKLSRCDSAYRCWLPKLCQDRLLAFAHILILNRASRDPRARVIESRGCSDRISVKRNSVAEIWLVPFEDAKSQFTLQVTCIPLSPNSTEKRPETPVPLPSAVFPSALKTGLPVTPKPPTPRPYGDKQFPPSFLNTPVRLRTMFSCFFGMRKVGLDPF